MPKAADFSAIYGIRRMLRFLFHPQPSLDWYFRSCAAAKQGTR